MVLVEVDELISDLHFSCQRIIVQGLVVARRKVMVWVLLVRQFPVQLKHAPLIALQVLLVFRIHSAQLAIKSIFEKQRANEELGETV